MNISTSSDELRGIGVLVLANAAWATASRINCHHIARRLSLHNDVLFVESIGGRTGVGHSGRDLARLTSRLISALKGPVKISDRLWRLSPIVVPIHWPSLHHFNVHLLRRQLAWAASRCFRSDRRVIWAFSPSFGMLSRVLSADAVVYHCVDQHIVERGPGGVHLEEFERRLAEWADLMVVTSRTLETEKRNLARRVLCVENPVDFNHFHQAADETVQVAPEMHTLHRPIVGYIGNIASYKIDFALLRSVAEQNEQMTFVLIGEIGVGESRTPVTELRKLRNVRLLGPRPFAELPGYIKGFDVCTIPFLTSGVGAHSFPMKFFEYLASGKPVVTTPLPALREYFPLCRVASDAESFAHALREAIEFDSTHTKSIERVRAAQEHGWDREFSQLSRQVSAIVDGRHC
jgi:glycosyltransferase involved in cell wall biosynthesis